MSTRLRAVAPLAAAVALIAFGWSELTLNATFHWFTVADHVLGKLGLPDHFHFVLPASFVSWGRFFALGANRDACLTALVASVTGTLAAIVVMTLGPALADSPHFWGLAVAIGVAGAGLVLVSALRADHLLSAAPAFACAASVLLWWFATGLDNYVPGGKGPHTVEALGLALTKAPLAAGTGSLGGLMSMPWIWAAISAGVSLACGAVLGLASVWLAGLATHVRPRAATATPEPQT
jgi:hypothetical protein